MTEATEKQIKYALSLGIDEAETYSKEVLKELIQKKVGNVVPKLANSKPQIQEIIASRHDVVIQRTEKPHSYEFGKASDRHKIYYNLVGELKEHIEGLHEAGLIENDIETTLKA